MGPLALLGSGEFMPWSAEIDEYMLSTSTSGDGSVAILPTASAPEGDSIFQSWATKGLEHYKSLGIDAFVIPMRTREEAFNSEYASMLERASYIFFSGGNPAYLADSLRDTPFWEAVLERRSQGAALGGCSAGACIMGETAPDPTSIDDPRSAINHPGLRVVASHVFGAHWDQLDNFVKGLRALIKSMVPKDWTLVGIDEDTALVLDDGDWRVFGRGGVHVSRDGQQVSL
ncbi:MAG: Type 1 glutamine amidotransferase-like domain-containing protein [Actinomycetota bacterium]